MLAKPNEESLRTFGGTLFSYKNGALGEIRTHGLCLRRAALYPLSYKRTSDWPPEYHLPTLQRT